MWSSVTIRMLRPAAALSICFARLLRAGARKRGATHR
jgi:hypothetical protein